MSIFAGSVSFSNSVNADLSTYELISVGPCELLDPGRLPLPDVRDQRISSQGTLAAGANFLGQAACNCLAEQLLLEKQRKRREREQVIDDAQIEEWMTNLHWVARDAGIFEFEHVGPVGRRERGVRLRAGQGETENQGRAGSILLRASCKPNRRVKSGANQRGNCGVAPSFLKVP